MDVGKSQIIEPTGSRLRDHTRTFDSGVRAWPAHRFNIRAWSLFNLTLIRAFIGVN